MLGWAARIISVSVGLIIIGLLIRWLSIFTVAPPAPPPAAPSAPPTFCIAVLAAVLVTIRVRCRTFFGFGIGVRLGVDVYGQVVNSRFVILTL